MNTAQRRGRRGVALVMVLWMMTIICAVALEVSLATRLRLQATRNGGESLRAFYLARAGVERVLSELAAVRDEPLSLADLRQSEGRQYANVELGGGTYTLLADAGGESGEALEFGVDDTCAALNVNTADEQVLRKLPGMSPELAAGIVALREERDQIYELEDLLLLNAADPELLFGEDRNQNGILDPEEDDGDESPPHDDADGVLDRGIARYLTCRSAVRNTDAEGQQRVDLNEADAEELVRRLEGVSQQQAQSIVQHRGNSELENIAQLLDVKLVRPRRQESNGNGDGDNGDQQGEQPQQEQRPHGRPGPQRDGGEEQYETTDQDAFSTADFKRIADQVTVTDEEVLSGRVNVNTAPAEVLACLPGLNGDLAVKIVARRRQRAFRSAADLLDVEGLSADKLKEVCGHLCVRSDVFRVRSYGVLNTGSGQPVYRCVGAVIDGTGDEIIVNSWRELH
ncbi:MAG: helix-hairpin-helix domain-containing protein [Candidatus Brocadiia bacterium]